MGLDNPEGTPAGVIQIGDEVPESRRSGEALFQLLLEVVQFGEVIAEVAIFAEFRPFQRLNQSVLDLGGEFDGEGYLVAAESRSSERPFGEVNPLNEFGLLARLGPRHEVREEKVVNGDALSFVVKLELLLAYEFPQTERDLSLDWEQPLGKQGVVHESPRGIIQRGGSGQFVDVLEQGLGA